MAAESRARRAALWPDRAPAARRPVLARRQRVLPSRYARWAAVATRQAFRPIHWMAARLQALPSCRQAPARRAAVARGPFQERAALARHCPAVNYLPPPSPIRCSVCRMIMGAMNELPGKGLTMPTNARRFYCLCPQLSRRDLRASQASAEQVWRNGVGRPIAATGGTPAMHWCRRIRMNSTAQY
jgi:hypothetical protein